MISLHSTRGARANAPWDVVILGAGMAGLTLARHLLLDTDRRVLMLERLDQVPPARQKVGESTVQLAGYYLSRVLDLEHHLLHEHFMKYNLRFYWRHGDGDTFEDYSSAYIRSFSNIPSYQVDRNVLESELLRLNLDHPRFQLVTGVERLRAELGENGETHRISGRIDGEDTTFEAPWVVDCTGRRRVLAKHKELKKTTSIEHAAVYWWVDGLIDVERLSDLSHQQRRLHPRRQTTGHLPTWMATNHFCDEGIWLWVIPLRGRTSLGLVFDRNVVDWSDVSSAQKATDFICQRFPLFVHELPGRDVIDFAGFKSFSHDCVQTLSADRWAMSGEAGRFADPLYSPGSDHIAIHNTLIVHAMGIEDPDERARFCQLSESLMKAIFHAYVPGYVKSYDCLGSAEGLSLKYVWELAIYFVFYVFPFINDLFTDRRFVVGYLRQFSRLGPWNRGVQELLSGYFQWQQRTRRGQTADDVPTFFDFTDLCTLKRAEKTFYKVGVDAVEAKRELSERVDDLEELARLLYAYVASEVVGDRDVVTNRAFVDAIDIENVSFDVDLMHSQWRLCRETHETMTWNLDPHVFDLYRRARVDMPQPATAGAAS